MSKRQKTVGVSAVILSSTLVGCAGVPKAVVGYYLPQSRVDVTLTQTATCAANNIPIIKNDVTIISSYSRGTVRKEIKFDDFGGPLAKSDSTIELYEDGRLKSINVKQTGQAGEAIGAFIKLLQQRGVFLSTILKADEERIAAACMELRALVGDGKPLTIVSRGTTDFSDEAETNIVMRQASVSNTVFAKLAAIFGRATATYSLAKPPALHSNNEPKGAALELVEPGVATIDVVVARNGEDKESFSSTAWVPQEGTTYFLPFQRSTLFGANEFELALSEAGKVTKVRYANTRDAAGALGVLTDAMKPETEPTTADQAKVVQSEADLIYQQQRLVTCQSDPANCPK